jgi:ribosomal protein S18 acetylase RimI-like enzyme
MPGSPESRERPTTRAAPRSKPPEHALAVRPARANDAGAIHSLHSKCFSDIFAGLLGDYMPPSKERADRERSWTGPIGSPHDRHAILVAERCDRVIGFVAVGPTRDAEHDRRTTGELRTVMVDSSDRGLGVARALISAGERAMRACRFSIATLWVLPENLRAVRCYERCGWRPDGAKRLGEFGGREIRSIRYSKPLAPQGPCEQGH